MPEPRKDEPVLLRPSLRSKLSSLGIVVLLAALAHGTYRWHPDFDSSGPTSGSLEAGYCRLGLLFAFLAGAILQMCGPSLPQP